MTPCDQDGQLQVLLHSVNKDDTWICIEANVLQDLIKVSGDDSCHALCSFIILCKLLEQYASRLILSSQDSEPVNIIHPAWHPFLPNDCNT